MKRFVRGLIAGLTFISSPLAHAQAESPLRATDTVDWKLFFNQIFAMEIHKEFPNDASYKEALKKFTAYTPKTFNQTLDDVLQANTSEEAYLRRLAIYDQESSYQTISKLDFAKSVPSNLRMSPAVASYLKGIEKTSRRSISAEENFFQTEESANFINAMSYTKSGKQEVALIMIPGFAAHTIKFPVFPEIMSDINTFWGRPEGRPYNDSNPVDIKYENYKEFYSRGGKSGKAFDILHPAGWEMGNTIGSNSESADRMADWIKNLPEEYANKKLILLGYSKGAGVSFEMLQRHPELKSRVIGILTYAGVVQGTHIARFGRDTIQKLLGNKTIEDLIGKMRTNGFADKVQSISPYFGDLDFSFIKLSQIKRMLEINGVNVSQLEDTADRFLGAREVTDLLKGISELAPDTRTSWNLKNFDNNLVNPNTFIFNMSGVTDIGAWGARPAENNTQVRDFSLLTPQLKDDNTIDWKNFSLDAWFLYISSIQGFRLSPGGIYDSQVDLQHTKTPWIDESPLSASVTKEELDKMWNDQDIRIKMNANGISSLEAFSNTARSKLIRFENRNNICAYDLGEFKGHHWSLFHQAFRAPNELSHEYATWDFPRKAFMKAVLQTFAMYNLVSQSTAS